jgi:hypothetical protein
MSQEESVSSSRILCMHCSTRRGHSQWSRQAVASGFHPRRKGAGAGATMLRDDHRFHEVKEEEDDLMWGSGEDRLDGAGVGVSLGCIGFDLLLEIGT